MREKFLFDSDGEVMHCCSDCGLLCKFKCPAHPDAPVYTVAVPWAMHLMTRELGAMNIDLKFRV